MSHRRLLRSSITFMALTVGACSVPVDPRGNLPTEAQVSQIKAGVTDKASVTRILGSPSTVAAFDTDTWYYVSQKTKEVAFFKPELLDQEVLIIDFDKNGVVSEMRHRGFEDRVAVVPNPNATPAPGRELNVFQQLIGNFGKFSGAGTPGGQSQTPGGTPGGPGR